MKKLSFLAFAAVGLLFGACSSDKDTMSGTQNGPQYDGQFLAFNINLPSDPQSTTRADDNGTGTLVDNGANTDGLPVEYAVKNAILLVFDGSAATDDAANFKSAYEIATHPWEDNTDPHVTETSKRIIQEVSGVLDNDLMLIILNNNGIVTVDGTNVKINGKTFVVGSDFTSTTYEDFRKAIATTTTLGAATMTTAGFYMANAVLANESGSAKEGTAPTTGFAVKTLVPITKVFKTHAEAEAAGTVDEVFVERGMAKVTVQQNDKKAMTGLTTLKWQITGWTLDNTNTKSYLVRSTDNVITVTGGYYMLNSQADATKEGYKNYRFMGNTAILSAPTYKYRTYFAEGGRAFEFLRKKTSETSNGMSVVIVPIIKPLQVILDEIGAKPAKDAYVFPQIFRGIEDETIRRKLTVQENSNIKDRVIRICKEVLGWEKKPSGTWARHSFATNLKHLGVEELYISESMGHSLGNNITAGYQDMYPLETRFEYNSKLLNLEEEKPDIDVDSMTPEQMKEMLKKVLGQK